MRRRQLSYLTGIATATWIAACGGNSGGRGGENDVASIEQSPCLITTSSGWQNEVHKVSWPSQLRYCPLVIKAGQRVLNGAGDIDVLLSRHEGPAGFEGRAKLWSVHRGSGVPDLLQSTPTFYFSANAPYVAPTTPAEQPIRGTFAVTWTAGILSSSGVQESDSLSIEFNTVKAYTNGLFVAAAFIKTPVVISSYPGSITGTLSLSPGGTGSWRSIPAWDTTGYRFQWAVDGTPVSGANSANFSQSFAYAGTYMVRVDQTLADDEVLTAYKQVTVPLIVNMSGDVSPSAYTTANFSASAVGGYAPYTYQWTWDGSSAGTDATAQGWAGGPLSSHTMEVTMTDSHGNAGYASANVWVPTEGGCDQEPCDMGRSASKTPTESNAIGKIPVIAGSSRSRAKVVKATTATAIR